MGDGECIPKIYGGDGYITIPPIRMVNCMDIIDIHKSLMYVYYRVSTRLQHAFF